MRADAQAAGHGIVPNVPLQRRRLGGVRVFTRHSGLAMS